MWSGEGLAVCGRIGGGGVYSSVMISEKTCVDGAAIFRTELRTRWHSRPNPDWTRRRKRMQMEPAVVNGSVHTARKATSNKLRARVQCGLGSSGRSAVFGEWMGPGFGPSTGRLRGITHTKRSCSTCSAGH